MTHTTNPHAHRNACIPPPQGSVSCANPILLELLPEFESEQERADGIVEKCVLTFDSLPFIPAEPYDVIRGGGRRGFWGVGAFGEQLRAGGCPCGCGLAVH